MIFERCALAKTRMLKLFSCIGVLSDEKRNTCPGFTDLSERTVACCEAHSPPHSRLIIPFMQANCRSRLKADSCQNPTGWSPKVGHTCPVVVQPSDNCCVWRDWLMIRNAAGSGEAKPPVPYKCRWAIELIISALWWTCSSARTFVVSKHGHGFFGNKFKGAYWLQLISNTFTRPVGRNNDVSRQSFAVISFISLSSSSQLKLLKISEKLMTYLCVSSVTPRRMGHKLQLG